MLVLHLTWAAGPRISTCAEAQRAEKSSENKTVEVPDSSHLLLFPLGNKTKASLWYQVLKRNKSNRTKTKTELTSEGRPHTIELRL